MGEAKRRMPNGYQGPDNGLPGRARAMRDHRIKQMQNEERYKHLPPVVGKQPEKGPLNYERETLRRARQRYAIQSS